MDIRFNLSKASLKKKTLSQQKKLRVTTKKQEEKTSSSLMSSYSPKDTKLSHTQAKGFSYEEIACEFLQSKGLLLLQKNLSCPLGEIDLVMQEGDILVFVEVRFRHHHHYGGALGSITPHKQQRLKKVAQYFLPYLCKVFFQGIMPYCRFDAVCIENTEKIWIHNIFDFQ